MHIYRTFRRSLLPCLLLTVGAANATEKKSDPQPAAPAVAHITQGKADKAGVAVRISSDTLLTSLSLQKGDVVQVSFGTGAADTAKHGRGARHDAAGAAAGVGGTVIAVNKDRHLALVKTNAQLLDKAGLTTYRLAYTSPAFADPLTLHAGAAPELRAVLQSPKRFLVIDRDPIRITGDAAPEGGALLNDCGELVGFLPGGDSTEAAVIPTLRALIEDAKIDVVDSTSKCVIAKDKDGLSRLITAESDRARDAHARVKELQAQAALFQQGNSAENQAKLASLQTSISNYERVAQKAENLIETIKDYRAAHKRDMIITIIVPILLVALLVGGAFLLRRGRRHEMDREKSIAVLRARSDEAERALSIKPWRDVTLRGQSGILKISAAQLSITGKGVLIGRNAQECDVLFGPDDVSRVHARLFVGENSLMVEDCGSSQGTFVNGRPLEPRSPVPLSSGDKLRLASHELEVRIL